LGFRTRNGNPFGKNSLTEILRNEKYKGIYIFNRASSYSHNHTRNNHKSKADEEIIRIPGGMPALVDEKTFDRVAAILKERSHNAPHKLAKETYLLTGKIFCGICGTAYTGNRQFAGRNKNLLITYRCSKHSNHGDMNCHNRDINRNYIEAFILKRIGEIIFSEERIPQLIAAYYESHEELAGDGAKVLGRLYNHQNEIQRKLDNIVSVITQTGSPSLLKTLEELEVDKVTVTEQIRQEEANLIANRLNEQEIIAAYRRAQSLFESGSLPQRKQLINLYVKRINVYPDYVQIHLHKIPANILSSKTNTGLPVVNDDGADLHIILKVPYLQEKSRLHRGGTGEIVPIRYNNDKSAKPHEIRVFEDLSV